MKREKIVYLYPFKHGNEFIGINNSLLESIGYTIKPIQNLLSFDCFFKHCEKIAIFNWAEDQPYRRNTGRVKSLLLFLGIILLILVAKISSDKVIWIKHNLKPHNTSKAPVLFKFICAWFRFLNIKPIPLEEYYCRPALKHPLYKDNETLIKFKNELGDNDTKEEISALFFGAIRPYKNLHLALDIWPSNIKLQIKGKADSKEYQQQLVEIIERKGLQVDWSNERVSDEDLDEALSKNTFVLLPHADGAMISSGSFYHAISLGCNVLFFDSRFAKYKAKTHSFANIIVPNNFNEQWLRDKLVLRDEVISEALLHYSRDEIIKHWKSII